MKLRTSFNNLIVGFSLGFLLLSAAASARAAIIDSEDFDGYTVFNDTPGDPSNAGVPLQIEGADSPNWLAARIGPAVDGTISSDIGVQQVGYPSSLGGAPPFNTTPSGRTKDNAALVLRLDLTNYENVMLSFDWRTHNAESTDEFVVAYHVGDGLGTPNNTYDWYSDPLLGNGSTAWFENPANWTKVLDQGRTAGPKPFLNETASLPGGDVVYLAFWLRYQGNTTDANAEFGKVDNILITGDLIPEPASGMLLLLGMSSLSVRRRIS